MDSVKSFEDYLRNCAQSTNAEKDWGFASASDAEFIDEQISENAESDLGEGCDWWDVRDQGATGACVGYTVADSLLRWVFVKRGWLKENEKLSERFLWMASKEIDEYTDRPTAFLEKQGTSLKTALSIVYKYGIVPAEHFPIDTTEESKKPAFIPLFRRSESAFYAIAAQYRISGYFNLIGDADKLKNDPNQVFGHWRKWLASKKNPSPIAIRIAPDRQFISAKGSGHLEQWTGAFDDRYHACAIVGFREGCFIIRNSWGVDWGDDGYVRITENYAQKAISEAYGIVFYTE